ncbi:hypothetical protein SMC37_004074 [Cronobacter sakazakii]|nr:hypothetical protein [Cronobacter sakazakii]ELY2734743.1 hypothetical protein [Cronobacter sakazakii]
METFLRLFIFCGALFIKNLVGGRVDFSFTGQGMDLPVRNYGNGAAKQTAHQ